MPLKNVSIEPATLRLSQLLEDVRNVGVTQVDTSSASTEVREVAIVRACTTANITLTNTQTVDGVALAVNDSVLVNNQTLEKNNGLFSVRTGAWERLYIPIMVSGLPVVVRQGTVNADTFFVEQREFSNYVGDVTDLKFLQVGAVTADFITSVGDTGTIDLTVSSSQLSGIVIDGSISTVKLADGAVTAVKLGTNSVISVKILDANVTTSKLADSAVTSVKLADNSVTTLKIVDSAVTEAKIANDAVTTVKILNNNVTTGKIADSAVTAVKLASDSVTTVKILDANVTTAKLADLAVTTAKLEDGAVTTVKLENDAVTWSKLASGSVGSKQLLIVNSDGYLDFYSGAGTPTQLGINVNFSKFTHHYKNETLTSGGVQAYTTHTLRFPSSGTDYYPIGIYHIDAYAVITALNFFNQTMNNTVAPTMTIKVSGIGGGTEIDNGLSHEDLASGTQKMINNSLQGSKIIDLTTTTKADRYFEIIITCNVNALITKSGVVGYVDIFELNPAGAITYDT